MVRVAVLVVLVFAVLLFAPSAARADEVVLRNGEVLVGRPTIVGQTLLLVLPTGEERAFPLSIVDRIRHDPGTVPVQERMPAGELTLPPPPESGVYERQGMARAVVVSCAPPCPSPCPPAPCDPCSDGSDACKWKGPWSISLGLSFTQAGGNSDSVAFKVDFELTYDKTPWKWAATGFYAYAESGGAVDTNRFFIESEIDRDLSSCLYAFVKGSYDRDSSADLDYRIIGDVGLGMTLLRGSSYELRGEVGGGGTAERRSGQPETVDPSAYVGLDFEKEWAKAGRIVVDTDFLPNLNDFDLSLLRFDVKYELPLSKCLSLRLGVRLDYQLDPVDPAVESLDWLTSAGLSVSF